MTSMAKPLTLWNQAKICRARNLVRRHPQMYQGNLVDIVKTFYQDIHGKPIGKLSEKQLNSIAERVWNESREIEHTCRKYPHILNNLIEMSTASGEKLQELKEDTALKLYQNDIPEKAYISRMYEQLKNKV